MTGFNALFIHGVGQQDSHFADEARSRLRAVFAERGSSLYACSVHWAPLADRVQEEFLEAAEVHGSKGSLTQKLVACTLADALMWQSSLKLREQTFALLDQQAGRFYGKPFTAFCHSLGGLIFTDWLRARPAQTSARLVTFGCNVGLFNLGSEFKPVPGLKEWVNFFCPRDMLGYPLRGMPGTRKLKVQDIRVSLGNIFTGWTGRTHVMYWTDRRFWNKSVPTVLGLRDP